MSLWDQLKKGIDDAASSVNREAQIFAKQNELGKIEGEIDRQYIEVGKCARELYRRRQLLLIFAQMQGFVEIWRITLS